jgi:hypothetical protein
MEMGVVGAENGMGMEMRWTDNGVRAFDNRAGEYCTVLPGSGGALLLLLLDTIQVWYDMA